MDEESELFFAFLKAAKQYRNARGRVNVSKAETAMLEAMAELSTYRLVKSIEAISDRYIEAGLFLPIEEDEEGPHAETTETFAG